MLGLFFRLSFMRLLKQSSSWSLFLSFGIISFMLLGMSFQKSEPLNTSFVIYILCTLALFLNAPAVFENDQKNGFLAQIYIAHQSLYSYLWGYVLAALLFLTALCLIILFIAGLFLGLSLEALQSLTVLMLLTTPSFALLLCLYHALCLHTEKALPAPLVLGPFFIPPMIIAFAYLKHAALNLSLQQPLLFIAAFGVLCFTLVPHMCHFLLKEALDT